MVTKIRKTVVTLSLFVRYFVRLKSFSVYFHKCKTYRKTFISKGAKSLLSWFLAIIKVIRYTYFYSCYFYLQIYQITRRPRFSNASNFLMNQTSFQEFRLWTNFGSPNKMDQKFYDIPQPHLDLFSRTCLGNVSKPFL